MRVYWFAIVSLLMAVADRIKAAFEHAIGVAKAAEPF